MWCPFVYSIVFFSTVCAVILTFFVLQTHRLATTSDNGDDPSPMVRQGSPPATVVTQGNYYTQDASDVFVGYDPYNERCQQFLFDRTVHRIEQRRRRRRLSDHFDTPSTAFDHFAQRSNEAIDRLLAFDHNALYDGTTSKRRRLSDILSLSDNPEVQEVDIQDPELVQSVRDLLANVTRRETRDVILPHILDEVISQNWKEIAEQSIDNSSLNSTLPTLQSEQQKFRFFDLEVVQRSDASGSPSSDGIILSSTNEEIVRTQWFNFVQMDKVSIPSSSLTIDHLEFASSMPCIAFIEEPKEHFIENEREIDLIEMNEEEDLQDSTEQPTTVDKFTNDQPTETELGRREKDGQTASGSGQRRFENDVNTNGNPVGDQRQLRYLSENVGNEAHRELDSSKGEQDELESSQQNASGILDTLRQHARTGADYNPLRGRQPISVRPVTPNDPDFKKQWSLKTIGAPEGWGVWTGPSKRSNDPGAVVAVIDTGCDLEHPELVSKFWRNPGEICDNGIDDDGNGYIDDCHGYNFNGKNANLTEQKAHGTSVSGAIAAETDNNFGIASVCWSCRIMCGRVGVNGFNTGNFAEALNYAMGWGVKVVNYSGNGGYSKIQDEAIRSALENDAIVVTCAGNSACDVDSKKPCADMGFPGKLEVHNIINVGASGYENQTASYSNYGRQSVHVFAPSGILLPHPGPKRFKIVYGTSFAAPIVSGGVALIRSRFPELSAVQAKQAILSTCSRDSEFNGKAQCPGILNLPEALKAAELMADASD